MTVTTRSQTRLSALPSAGQDSGKRKPGNTTAQRKRRGSHRGAEDDDHQGGGAGHDKATKRLCHSTKESTLVVPAIWQRMESDDQHPLFRRIRGEGAGADCGNSGLFATAAPPTMPVVGASRPATSHSHGVGEDADTKFPGVGRFLASGASAPSPSTMAHEEEQARKRELKDATPSPPSSRLEREEKGEWRPTPVIGQSLGDNLSTMEEAERMVRSLQEVYQHARRKYSAEALGGIAAELEQVTKWRDELKARDAKEDMIPYYDLPEVRQQIIRSRIDLLGRGVDRVIKESGSDEQIKNMLAAKQGYKDGTIQYWDKWTLIYAGHIMETAPSYDAFTVDRHERLDRYARRYGEGWLWWEAPLAPPNRDVGLPKAMRGGTYCVQRDEPFGYGGWKVVMGFQRLKSMVYRPDMRRKYPAPKGKELVDAASGAPRRRSSRISERSQSTASKMPFSLQTESSSRKGSSEKEKGGEEEEEKEKNVARGTKTPPVTHDPDAPRIHFDMVLDSACTYPVLIPNDLRYLGIDRDYPATSECDLRGIGSRHDVPMYEMYVTVTTPDCVPLVDADKAVWPQQRRQIGTVAPVLCMALNDVEPEPIKLDKNGTAATSRNPVDVAKGRKDGRLSGMLPFTVCYFSGTPGTGNIWLGEDRRDVLGAHRMPGQQRSTAIHGECQTGHPSWDRLNGLMDLEPSIRFEHELVGGGKLIDEESAGRPGRSILRLLDAQGRQKETLEIFPGRGYQKSKIVKSYIKTAPARKANKKVKQKRVKRDGVA